MKIGIAEKRRSEEDVGEVRRRQHNHPLYSEENTPFQEKKTLEPYRTDQTMWYQYSLPQNGPVCGQVAWIITHSRWVVEA